MISIRQKPLQSWFDPRSVGYLSRIMSDRLSARLKGKRALFLTLTYDRSEYDSPLELYRKQSERQDVPLFLRRLARAIGVKSFKGKWIRKMEFHEGGWVHFHLILMHKGYIHHDTINQCWGHGRTDVSRATDKSIRYLAKYVTKSGQPPSFILSEKPRSVKVFACSPGFWGTESKTSEKPHPSLSIPVYKSIGQTLEESSDVLLVKDREKYRSISIQFHELILLLKQCQVKTEFRDGWLCADISLDTLRTIIATNSTPQPRSGGACFPLSNYGKPDAPPRWYRFSMELEHQERMTA